MNQDREITATYIKNCERFHCRVLSSIIKLFSEADRAPIPPTKLDLSAEYIGNEGVRALVWTIVDKLPHLKILSLKSCGVEEGAVLDMAEAFKGNEYLQELDLRQNNLYASSGRALIALLRSNPKLYRLAVDTHEMPERVEMAIRKAEKRNYDTCFPPPPPPPEVDKYQTRERLDALLDELEFLRGEDSQLSGFTGVTGSSAPSATLGSLSADSINTSNAVATLTTTGHSLAKKQRTNITDATNKIPITLPPATSPSDQRKVTAIRLMHYWNLRLGSFGVQYILDKGMDMATMRSLVDIEKRARVVEGLTDVRAVAPFREPLELVQAELDTIGAALSDPNSLLSQLSALREGGTISMQYQTCRRIFDEIRQSQQVPSAQIINSKRPMIELLMVTLHHLRMGIAAGTLRDFADTVLGPIPPTRPTSSVPSHRSFLSSHSRTAYSATPNVESSLSSTVEAVDLATHCRDFEEAMQDAAQYLARTVYESTRKLSLVCDEMRYFSINNKGFIEGVLARGATMTRKATTSPAEREDEGGDLTAYAVELYTDLLEEPSHTLHAQRRILLDRLAELLTVDMNIYLAHYEEARAHQGGIRERFSEEWGSVASYLHPFLVWEPPAVDPYKEFAIPALPDRPRPTRIADEHADLKDRIVNGPQADSVAKASGPDANAIALQAHADKLAAADIMGTFGAITNKADLLKWFRQFSGYVRYAMVLSS